MNTKLGTLRNAPGLGRLTSAALWASVSMPLVGTVLADADSLAAQGQRQGNFSYYDASGIRDGRTRYGDQPLKLCSPEHPEVPAAIYFNFGQTRPEGSRFIRASVNPTGLNESTVFTEAGDFTPLLGDACPLTDQGVRLDLASPGYKGSCRFDLDGAPYIGTGTAHAYVADSENGKVYSLVSFPRDYYRGQVRTRFTLESTYEKDNLAGEPGWGTFEVLNNCHGCINEPAITNLTLHNPEQEAHFNESTQVPLSMVLKPGCQPMSSSSDSGEDLSYLYYYVISFQPDYDNLAEQILDDGFLGQGQPESVFTTEITLEVPEDSCQQTLQGQVRYREEVFARTASNAQGERTDLFQAVQPFRIDRNFSEAAADGLNCNAMAARGGLTSGEITAITLTGCTACAVAGGIITTIVVYKALKRRGGDKAGTVDSVAAATAFAAGAAIQVNQAKPQTSSYLTGWNGGSDWSGWSAWSWWFRRNR